MQIVRSALSAHPGSSQNHHRGSSPHEVIRPEEGLCSASLTLNHQPGELDHKRNNPNTDHQTRNPLSLLVKDRLIFAHFELIFFFIIL